MPRNRIDPDQPAYPMATGSDHPGQDWTGLTKRECVAAQVYAAMIGNGELAALLVADMDNFPGVAARAAVKAADALLAELAK